MRRPGFRSGAGARAGAGSPLTRGSRRQPLRPAPVGIGRAERGVRRIGRSARGGHRHGGRRRLAGRASRPEPSGRSHSLTAATRTVASRRTGRRCVWVRSPAYRVRAGTDALGARCADDRGDARRMASQRPRAGCSPAWCPYAHRCPRWVGPARSHRPRRAEVRPVSRAGPAGAAGRRCVRPAWHPPPGGSGGTRRPGTRRVVSVLPRGPVDATAPSGVCPPIGTGRNGTRVWVRGSEGVRVRRLPGRRGAVSRAPYVVS